MSYPAIVGAAGLVIVSVFAITEHTHRMKTNSEFGLALRGGPETTVDPTVAGGEKSTAVIGLPTAPEEE
jgi:hypothetical protein